MKKVWVPVIAFLLLLTLTSGKVMAYSTANNDAAISDSGTASNNLENFLNATSSDYSQAYYTEFEKQADATVQDLWRASGEFTTQGLSAKEAKAVAGMKSATQTQAQVAEDWAQAAKTNNLRASDKASVRFEELNGSFNAAYDDYTRARYLLTDSQFKLVYWTAFITCALVAFITVLWLVVRNFACSHKKTAKEIEQQKERKKLARISLAPFAGAAITLLTYYVAIGGYYTVAWGAIVLGMIAYIRAIMQYRKFLKAPAN